MTRARNPSMQIAMKQAIRQQSERSAPKVLVRASTPPLSPYEKWDRTEEKQRDTDEANQLQVNAGTYSNRGNKRTRENRQAAKRPVAAPNAPLIIATGFPQPRAPRRPQVTSVADQNSSILISGKVEISKSILDISQQGDYASFPLNSTTKQKNFEREEEFIIGLDFGTTFCKVVVRSQSHGTAWAVPLSNNDTNPYLLPTRVFKQGSKFALAEKGTAFNNLKLKIFDQANQADSKVNATAFLALILSHVKRWFWKFRAAEFPGAEPFWFYHMGMPTSNLANTALKRSFEEILLAAALVSANNQTRIDQKAVQGALAHVSEATSKGIKNIALPNCGVLDIGQIRLFPEVAAQIYGYFLSDQRDPNLDNFLLVDVGGGTVDAGLFRVHSRPDGEKTVVFHSTAVDALGVYVLHLTRLSWLVGGLSNFPDCQNVANKLLELRRSELSPAIIPGKLEEYLTGITLPKKTCDKEIADRFSDLLWKDIILDSKKRTGFPLPGAVELPFLLCGGGRSIALYDHFQKCINSPSSSTQLKLRLLAYDRPAGLEPKHLTKEQFHRLSVAYGLSVENIGEVITPKALAPMKQQPMTAISDLFVGKEMC